MASEDNGNVAALAGWQEIYEEAGLISIQKNGQRILCPSSGPSEDFPLGAEVFVGNLPQERMEDTIYHLFKAYGTLKQIRLMMRSENVSKGHGFVLFENAEQAKNAVQNMNGHVLYEGKRWELKVTPSQDFRRIYIGRIPKNLTKDEIWTDFETLGLPGVKQIFLYKDWSCHNKNRGFCFVEFHNHRLAMEGKNLLQGGRLAEKWRTVNLKINWAYPLPVADEGTMAQVKKIFIRGLRLETEAKAIKRAVAKAINVEVDEWNIRKSRDYAFVKFHNRESALEAIRKLNGQTIDKAEVEVMFANPVHKELKRKSTVSDSRISVSNNFQDHTPWLPYDIIGVPAIMPAIIDSSYQWLDFYHFYGIYYSSNQSPYTSDH